MNDRSAIDFMAAFWMQHVPSLMVWVAGLFVSFRRLRNAYSREVRATEHYPIGTRDGVLSERWGDTIVITRSRQCAHPA